MKKHDMVIGLAFLTVLLTVLLAVAVAVTQFGLSRVKHACDSLDPQTGIVLGVSGTVAILCSALIGHAIRSMKQREIDSRILGERVALYQALMESFEMLLSEEEPAGGRNGTDDLIAVEKGLFLRGNVTVNNEYRALLRLLSNPGADEKVLRSQITKLLLALRRDCGQPTKGMEGKDWSDLLRFASRLAASERSADSRPAHFTGADSAPPTHRLSPLG
jgi:hypothetical protein